MDGLLCSWDVAATSYSWTGNKCHMIEIKCKYLAELMHAQKWGGWLKCSALNGLGLVWTEIYPVGSGWLCYRLCTAIFIVNWLPVVMASLALRQNSSFSFCSLSVLSDSDSPAWRPRESGVRTAARGRMEYRTGKSNWRRLGEARTTMHHALGEHTQHWMTRVGCSSTPTWPIWGTCVISHLIICLVFARKMDSSLHPLRILI